MVGSELAGPLGITAILLLLVFTVLGWTTGPAGVAAQVVLAAAIVGFVVALVRGMRSRRPMEEAVERLTGDRVRLDRPGLAAVVSPGRRRPRRLVVDEALRYGPNGRHLVDRIGRPATVSAPALVYVHGGGWWRGRRSTQARPMVHRLALAGWQVFTPSYRLSPDATFPDHLVDVKRSVAWIRSNADRFGLDPGFIAIAGGSTGGNIAALAALTNRDRSLQPGFEDEDATVQACVPIYGVHDMLKDDGRPLWPYLAESVMKSDPESDPESWRRASPIRMARSDRPPFFVIHGATDTLVGPVLSRRLVDALRDAGGPPVGHAEVPWANHGFDFFAGPRGRINAAAIEAALGHLRNEHLQRLGGSS